MTEVYLRCISDGDLRVLEKLDGWMTLMEQLVGSDILTTLQNGMTAAIVMLSCLTTLKLTKSHRLRGLSYYPPDQWWSHEPAVSVETFMRRVTKCEHIV
jgi:hypothetical protein